MNSAARFGVAPSTVINWVRRFQETGSAAPAQMGGHKPKAIAGEHAMFLARRVRDGAFTCGAWWLNWLSAASRSIIDRCGISFTPRSSASKKTVVASERDRPDVARRRAQWTKRQSGVDPKRLVFIDETPAFAGAGYGRRPTWSRRAAGRRAGEARRQGSPRPLANHDLCRRASSRPHRGAVAHRRSDQRRRLSNLCREGAGPHA